MGKVEQKVINRARREKIQEKLLLALFRLTTPNSLAFAPESVLRKRLGLAGAGRPVYRMHQALKRLETKGLVRPERRGIILTDKGKKFSEKLDTVDRIKIKIPKQWDEKWRIVIFDVWERRRAVRDKLRLMLQKAGFRRLQDSVWVYPYECEELVVFLRADLQLGPGLIYLVADGIENDGTLRRLFNL